ncbi:MAG: FKBP-type peptidyl-prolyl cis-trans isomerase [Burkholderiales bacterium]|nr:FKBP-type peptidyl-prolyl cis-trans isomerase [Burkholderiales bacterium]
MKSVLSAIACFLAAATLHGAAQADSDNQPAAALSQPAPLHVASLIKTDTEIGSGAEATYGALLEVHYTGWLYNHKAENLHGQKFDSSRDAGKPLTFQLGARQVIRGWELGVQGMKVGGKRTLIIPSYLGYSTAGSGTIPPNTHLVFDIELLSVK